MSKAYEFLKACDSFFVLTINGDYPAGRPFGAVLEEGNDLYLSTSDINMTHAQISKNKHIQIVAKKEKSRKWIRITGTATECSDRKLKQKMIDEYPILQKRFEDIGMQHFILVKVKIENVELK